KISVKPGTGVCLPPFADAHQLVEQGETLQSVDEHSLPDLDEDEGDEEEEKRDILGEMEISARMMITGGDPKEEAALKRADRAMIREALLMATHTTYREGRQMLPVDLQSALWEISRDTQRNDVRRAKAAEMAESLGMFTQPGSFEAELFNREGKLWPEADVTLIDLGHLAREGYEAQMALTMVSMTNMINNIAERDQYLGRDILFVVDEAHIVTVNPLLSPYMTKVVKMWRKLGA
ncbi:conjugative transfer ATPase, partial [Escherichia coli]|nr:conjugative transfer ATPase [Escherichia coli]